MIFFPSVAAVSHNESKHGKLSFNDLGDHVSKICAEVCSCCIDCRVNESIQMLVLSCTIMGEHHKAYVCFHDISK